MYFHLLVLIHLPIAVLAAPTSNPKHHVVHERRERQPTQWRRSAKLHGESQVPIQFALTQNNLERAEEFLLSVSDPDSANYGKYWTAKQVAETFAPSEETFTSVIDWLGENGITRDCVEQSQSLSWVSVNMTISDAERLLDTEYFVYEHSVTGQLHIGCEEYSLPKHIIQHIDFVTPTVHFDAKVGNPKERRDLTERELDIAKRQKSAVGHSVQSGVGLASGSPADKSLPKKGGSVPAGANLTELEHCDISIVPDCLCALYGFPLVTPHHPKNSFGIVEYTPQAYLPDDLDLFFADFSPSLVGQRPTLDSIDGGFLQTHDQSFEFNGESNLDLGYAMSLVYPQKGILYQVGDDLQGASFNNFLDALDKSYCFYAGGVDPHQDGIYPDPYGSGFGVYKGPENCGGFAATNVISTSYGYNEADLTPAYEMRQCHEYMKLGLQGVTFLYSSGDCGVAGNGDQCIDPVTGEYNDGTSGRFNPSFPSGCPYVTSVGATQIKPGASVTEPEVTADKFIYSGGGFSNVFSLGSYQKKAMAIYFAKHKPPYGPDQYNNSQRALIAVNGNFSYVFGTSASAPTFGGILTLINSERLSLGKAPVGFINPVIYKSPGMFNDITEGGNQGCGTAGFSAVPGWDPVTGLGTPNYPKMLRVWLGLP